MASSVALQMGDPSSRRRKVSYLILRRVWAALAIFHYTAAAKASRTCGGLEKFQCPSAGRSPIREAAAWFRRPNFRRASRLIRDRREAYSQETDPAEFRAACDALATASIKKKKKEAAELGQCESATLVMGRPKQTDCDPCRRCRCELVPAGCRMRAFKISPGAPHVPPTARRPKPPSRNDRRFSPRQPIPRTA